MSGIITEIKVCETPEFNFDVALFSRTTSAKNAQTLTVKGMMKNW
jgi:hypothetical protein